MRWGSPENPGWSLDTGRATVLWLSKVDDSRAAALFRRPQSEHTLDNITLCVYIYIYENNTSTNICIYVRVLPTKESHIGARLPTGAKTSHAFTPLFVEYDHVFHDHNL